MCGPTIVKIIKSFAAILYILASKCKYFLKVLVWTQGKRLKGRGKKKRHHKNPKVGNSTPLKKTQQSQAIVVFSLHQGQNTHIEWKMTITRNKAKYKHGPLKRWRWDQVFNRSKHPLLTGWPRRVLLITIGHVMIKVNAKIGKKGD